MPINSKVVWQRLLGEELEDQGVDHLRGSAWESYWTEKLWNRWHTLNPRPQAHGMQEGFGTGKGLFINDVTHFKFLWTYPLTPSVTHMHVLLWPSNKLWKRKASKALDLLTFVNFSYFVSDFNTSTLNWKLIFITDFYLFLCF